MPTWSSGGRRGGPPPGGRGRSSAPGPGRGPTGPQPAAQRLARLPLPGAVASLVRQRERDPIHPGFLITRFVRWAVRKDSGVWTFKVEVERSGRTREEDRKVENLQAAARATADNQGRRLHELATAWRDRRAAWLEPLAAQGLAETFRAKTDWRLTIGLTGPSPLETGIRLHHVFGLPALPGSSLKGLARAAARSTAADEVLGSPNAAGLVDVLDAIPIPQGGRPLLEVDVMNPHYPLWYRQERDRSGKRIPPSDDQSPTPVFFLAVPAGTEFEFALLCRLRTERAREALRRAVHWLRAGLTELGAGAKTAAGYGYFDEVMP